MSYENVNEVLGALVHAYYDMRDVDTTLACVTDDIEWIGTEEHECASGKHALGTLLAKNIKSFPNSFEIAIDEPVIQWMGENAAIAHIRGKQAEVPGLIAGFAIRGSAGCVKTSNGWLINHLHVSVPNAAMENYFLEKKLDETCKKEQLLSGIPGGVAIYRLKKNGRVYTDLVSDGFAKISGFDNGRALCKLLKENAFVNMFEEDANEALETLKKSLVTNQPISIVYRAHGKNGDVLLQRMDANVIDSELGVDDLAVLYAVHTVVSDTAKQMIFEQNELHKLIDYVPTGIGIYEIRNGTIIQNYVNNAFYRMLGSSRETRTRYFGENTMNAVHPDDKSVIYNAMKLIESGEDSYSVDYRLELENRTWFWVHLVCSVVERTPDYIRIYAAISDYNAVKERELQFEEQLRLSRAATADALSKIHINLSQNTVTYYDSATDEYKPHERFRAADDLLASIKNDVADENELKKYECVADCDTIIRGYRKGISHYEIISHIHDTRWTKVIYDVLENVYTGDIEMISSIHDVSDQVRSDLVINKLMEIAYKSILLVDNKTGLAFPYKRGGVDDSVDEINAGMEQTGSQKEGLEAFFREHALPDKVEEVIRENSPETIAQMLKTSPYYECMYSLIENGKLSQYKVTYSYLEKDKRILLSAVQDVTQIYEKEMQQRHQLALALAEADAANKAKTAFLSRISHDMRTPLNGILGLTTLLKDSITDNNLLRDLNQLETSGNYLLNLINDTLDVSRIESGKLELHPVVTEGKLFFHNAMELAKTTIESKNIHYHIHIDKLPFTILYDDVARLEQIIMNVISNAVKFTPEGGTIDISVKNIAVEDGVITDQLIVQDTGIGMSPAFIPHIFEAFSQEDASRTANSQGTGLGMSITKQLLELMHGDIAVKSELGKGTCVTVTMKLHIASEEQVKEWKKSKDYTDYGMDISGKRVLLCEDHPLNAQIATRLLAAKGIVVDHAKNGQIGLDLFQQSIFGYYDAILMDIRMPVMDGLDATRAIRNLPRRDARMVPIIAMTANAFQDDVEQTRNVGMDAHLSKPINKETFYHTLASLIKVDHTKKQKVLVVDDMEVNRAIIRASLKDDYEIVEAENGKQALERMESISGIDMVITDIQMPEIDGIELIKQLRNNPKNRHMVILANTQYGGPEQEEQLLRLGADDFVYKPNTPKILEVRVRNALRKI